MTQSASTPITPPRPHHAAFFSRPAVVLGLLLVLVSLAYLPAFHAGTIWDDDQYVVNNANLRTVAGLRATWTDPRSLPQYYPMVHTMFWVEYHLWGVKPAGYHAVNILLHALNAFLLWLVLRRLKVPGALAAAVIFALHPIEVESVAWITEGKNTLSTALGLGAVLAYLHFDDLDAPSLAVPSEPTRALPPATESPAPNPKSQIPNPQFFSFPRRWSWYLPVVLLFAAAVLSKTVAATLVGVLGVLIWWKRGRLRLRDLAPLLPLLIAGAALGLNTARLERVRVGAIGRDWDFSLLDRCLIAGRVIWFYAAKIVLPVNLAFIYPRWTINPRAPLQYAAPLGVVAVVLLLWLARRRLGRGPLAAVLCFIGVLFPALGFFNVYPMRFSFVADHFQYLAGTALIALLAAIGWHVWRRIPEHFQRTGPLLGGLGIATLGLTTALQCLPYHDAKTLWTDTLARNPGALIAYLNLADTASQEGDADGAIDLMERAVRATPDDPKAWAGLGEMYLRAGRRDDAVRAYTRATRIYRKPEPELGGDDFALAKIYLQLDRPAPAVQLCDEALAAGFITADVYELKGTALLQDARPGDAVAPLRRGLEVNPGSASLHTVLAAALIATGQHDPAIAVLREGLKTSPRSLLMLNRLALELATRPHHTAGDAGEALALAEKACALVPQPDAGLLDTLAIAQASAGRFPQAAQTATHAADLARAQGQGEAAKLFAGHAALFREGKCVPG